MHNRFEPAFGLNLAAGMERIAGRPWSRLWRGPEVVNARHSGPGHWPHRLRRNGFAARASCDPTDGVWQRIASVNRARRLGLISAIRGGDPAALRGNCREPRRRTRSACRGLCELRTHLFWLAYEDFPIEVSLDPQDSDASALVRAIRQKLLDHRRDVRRDGMKRMSRSALWMMTITCSLSAARVAGAPAARGRTR